MTKSFKQFFNESRIASGGRDNAGGQYYDVKNSDGTIGMSYVPGKQHSSSSPPPEIKPEPKHPLLGKKVTAKHGNGEEVTGRFVKTELGGQIAVIKHHKTGVLHSTDATTVKKA
jgi:hypothetical protein